MTATRTRIPFATARKNPLRLAAEPAPVIGPHPPSPPAAPLRTTLSPQEARLLMISEFGA
jgi:hypothetical protein